MARELADKAKQLPGQGGYDQRPRRLVGREPDLSGELGGIVALDQAGNGVGALVQNDDHHVGHEVGHA
jgi:hypothetical protein